MADKRMSRKDAEQHLLWKAWKDEQFYRRLLADPKAAIEAELGLKFADDAQITVHQETGRTLHVVLPLAPQTSPPSPEVAGEFLSYHLSPECDDPVLTEGSPLCRNE